MNYEFEIREIEPITVATLGYKGKALDAAKYFPKVFKSIQGKACGAPMCCFKNIDEGTQTGDVEICVPIAVVPSTHGIMVKDLPRIKAVCTTHIGKYEKLRNAYKALEDYFERNGLSGGLPVREVYIKGPGMFFKGNQNKYITEVIIPIIDDESGGGV
ncbi:MAG: GyrI-like domain-containing protein [Eubacteriales bacterium]